mmetsp:Transcript_43956/g.108793  ORF Transcript_43956/g.108793 Transcript_43956/m.108793 type:complete len:216 (-) Transcript_43956:618-1265(-)
MPEKHAARLPRLLRTAPPREPAALRERPSVTSAVETPSERSTLAQFIRCCSITSTTPAPAGDTSRSGAQSFRVCIAWHWPAQLNVPFRLPLCCACSIRASVDRAHMTISGHQSGLQRSPGFNASSPRAVRSTGCALISAMKDSSRMHRLMCQSYSSHWSVTEGLSKRLRSSSRPRGPACSSSLAITLLPTLVRRWPATDPAEADSCRICASATSA